MKKYRILSVRIGTYAIFEQYCEQHPQAMCYQRNNLQTGDFLSSTVYELRDGIYIGISIKHSDQ